jgi:hypothetical protein
MEVVQIYPASSVRARHEVIPNRQLKGHLGGAAEVTNELN